MLSTPLTCCSIGVATAFSMVSASAPGKMARTRISGGAISGNCATGRLVIVIAPTMTIRIEMTIATIGRRMKNLDMGSALLRLDVRGFGNDGSPFRHLSRSFHNHVIARTQALSDLRTAESVRPVNCSRLRLPCRVSPIRCHPADTRQASVEDSSGLQFFVRAVARYCCGLYWVGDISQDIISSVRNACAGPVKFPRSRRQHATKLITTGQCAFCFENQFRSHWNSLR